MNKGWDEHISLTFLTDAYCRSPEAALQEAEPLAIKGGRVVAGVSKSLADPVNEAKLSFIEWTQGMGRLLILIADYFPHIVQYWEQHWAIVYHHEKRDSNWPAVMLYCMEIRERSVSSLIQCQKYQKLIFDNIVDRERTRLVDEARQLIRAHQAGPSSSFRSYSTSKYPTATPSSTNPTTPSAHPADKPTSRCFKCGTIGHAIKQCQRSNQYNGRPIIVDRASRGWTIDGREFCYKFNSPAGCHGGEQCKSPRHLCSLCRSANHGAQACNAGS